MLVGTSSTQRLLVVVHTDRGDRIRLISAREANSAEPQELRRVMTMRKEYDFSKGTRGKYSDRLSSGVTVVVLDADVAKTFPTSEEVNAALRRPGKGAQGERVAMTTTPGERPW